MFFYNKSYLSSSIDTILLLKYEVPGVDFYGYSLLISAAIQVAD